MDKYKRLFPYLIAFISGLLYVNTLGHDYTLDDAIVITDNMYTQQGINGLGGIFSRDSFFGFFKEEGKDKLVAGGRYRPLSLATFALEYELFGRAPFVSHLVNVLLYMLLCALIYSLMLTILRHRSAHPHILALTIAVVFATHPIHTEVVANIKGRDELMALLFALGGLFVLMRKHGFMAGIISALLFLFALLSKENAIVMLAIVPVTFYFFRNLSIRSSLSTSMPVFIAAGVFLFIWFSVLGFSKIEAPLELMNNPFIKLSGNKYVPFSMAEKTGTIAIIMLTYLRLLFFPHPLVHDYYPRQIEIATLADPLVWIALITYLGLIVAALRGVKKRAVYAYAILFFLISISIYSNIVFPIGTNLSERFLFMPSLGFAILVGWYLVKLYPTRNTWFWILSVALAGAFCFKTVSRNMDWQDNYTLFTTDVNLAGRSAKLRNATAGILLDEVVNRAGVDDATVEKVAREAIEHLRVAIEIHPNYKNAHLLLGNAYFYIKDYDRAVVFYKNALRLDPNYSDAQRNLFIAYRNGGKYFGERAGNVDKAIEYLQQAYALRQDDYELLRLMGVAYGVRGEHDAAIRYFREAANIKPDRAESWINLGKAAYNSGKTELANQYFEQARRIDPEALNQKNQ